MASEPCEIELETGVILDGDIPDGLLFARNTSAGSLNRRDDTEQVENQERHEEPSSEREKMYAVALDKLRKNIGAATVSAAIMSRDASDIFRSEIRSRVMEILSCGDPMTTIEISNMLDKRVGGDLFPKLLVGMERAGKIKHLGREVISGRCGRGYRVWQSIDGKKPVAVDGKFSRFACGKMVIEEPEYINASSL